MPQGKETADCFTIFSRRMLRSTAETVGSQTYACGTRIVAVPNIHKQDFTQTESREYALLYSVQTGSGSHPASYTMNSGAFFFGAMRQGREADHSTPSSTEIKIDGGVPPLSTSLHGVVFN
jgi:hypothetical protein